MLTAVELQHRPLSALDSFFPSEPAQCVIKTCVRGCFQPRDILCLVITVKESSAWTWMVTTNLCGDEHEILQLFKLTIIFYCIYFFSEGHFDLRRANRQLPGQP